jgi:hypothetical protein
VNEWLRRLFGPKDYVYSHKTIWGKDRRAQGPMELRRNNATGEVDWKYNGSEWSLEQIPGEITMLFEEPDRA